MNSSENPAPVAASGADTSATSVPPPAAGEDAAPPLSGDVAKLEAELAQARKEAADHYDRYVRIMADFENARKRTIREKEELRQFAAARVLEDLIPVLDSLALAVSAAKAPNADLKSLVGGVDMVVNQAKAAMGQHGLKELNPVGQPFDPIPQLLAVAEHITKCHAVCSSCGAPASRSFRTQGGHDRVQVGAGDSYEARCRGCYQRGVAELAARDARERVA